MENWFEEFVWHSALDNIGGKKRFCNRLPNSSMVRQFFAATNSGNYLVHKTTSALWRVSEDGKSIEPVFDSDVLSENELEDLED